MADLLMGPPPSPPSPAPGRPAAPLPPGLHWLPALAIGVASIDQQHRELFRRVNELLEAIREMRGPGEIRRLLDFLARHAAEHFADEERAMGEAGYPELAVQQREHGEFARDFQALRVEFLESGTSPALAVRLNVWLCGWLRRHVDFADRRFGTWLESRPGV